jgi:transposase
MRAYSTDLRTHLLQATGQGTPKAEAVQLFGVSVRTINRYLVLRRRTGDAQPAPIPGRPRKVTSDQEDALRQQLRDHPTATLAEQCELWAAEHEVRPRGQNGGTR